LALAIGLWHPAIASWTDPSPATRVAFQIGCGTDSGLSVQTLQVGSKSYFLRSASGGLFDRSLSIVPLSVGKQVPIQVFSFAAQTPTDFRVVNDQGECSLESAIEAIGIALDRTQATASIGSGNKIDPLAYKRISATRIELDPKVDWSLRDPSGTSVSVASRYTSSAVVLDLSPLPQGTYFLRSGSKTSSLVKF
jgi:hypothetical protein